MADTTVTGRIGDMDVALINAASEATMQKLLETMNQMSARMGGNTQQQAGTQNAAGTATAVASAGKAVGTFTNAIAEATKSVISFAGELIGGTIKSFMNLGRELFLGGDRVSDFTKHLATLPSIFGTLGSAIHTVASFIDTTIDTFRNLSQVGATYSGTITSTIQAAAMSGMSLERFSKVVSANSETIAKLGDSVNSGSIAFGRMSRQLREGQTGQQLMNMGFTIDDINETLLTYININSRMNRDRSLSERELIARAGEFGEELQRAAAISGVSRQKLLQTADTLSKDAALFSIVNQLPEAQRKSFQTELNTLLNIFPESQDLLLRALKGNLTGPDMAALSSFAPNIINIMEKFRKGGMTAIEAQNLMIEAARKGQLGASKLGPAAISLLDEKMPGFKKAVDSITEMASKNAKSQAEINKILEDAKRQEGLDKFFKTFTDTVERFRARLIDNILSNAKLKEIGKRLDAIIGKDDGKMFKEVLTFIERRLDMFLDWLGRFISDIEETSLADALEKQIMEIFNISKEDRWTKPDKNGEQRYMSLTETIMGKVGDAMLEGVKTLFGKMFEAAIDAVKEHWLAITGVVVGLLVGGKVLGKLGGGGAAQGAEFSAMKALGGSFAEAASWLMKGAAIGASMVAIGYGFGKLAEGIAPLKDINWETLGKAGATLGVLTGSMMILGKVLSGPQLAGFALGTAAIAALGLAISQFPEETLRGLAGMIDSVFNGVATTIEKVFNGIKGIIDSITSMRTAVMEATTKQITDLANVPSENIQRAAKGIEALKLALDGFAPGAFRGFSEMMGGWFASDKVGPLEKMAELGPKLELAAPGFSAFKQAMSGEFNVNGLSLTREQFNTVKGFNDLLPQYAKGLEAIGTTGPNLTNAATALKTFREASEGFTLKEFTFTDKQLANLADGTKKLAGLAVQLKNTSEAFKKLDDQGLEKLRSGINSLSEDFKKFNESFTEGFIRKFDETFKTKTTEGILTDVGKKLDTLNSTVTSLVTIENESKNHLNTIATKKPGKVQ